jgi:hypothetical protein
MSASVAVNLDILNPVLVGELELHSRITTWLGVTINTGSLSLTSRTLILI